MIIIIFRKIVSSQKWKSKEKNKLDKFAVPLTLEKIKKKQKSPHLRTW